MLWSMELREHERKRRETRCPYCRETLSAVDGWRCPSCKTSHHLECAQEHGGCTVFACRGKVPSRRFTAFVEEWSVRLAVATPVIFVFMGISLGALVLAWRIGMVGLWPASPPLRVTVAPALSAPSR